MTADRPDATTARARVARPIDPGQLVPGALTRGVFRGRPVSVLGFARSGIALARFLADAGAEVTVYDGRPPGDLARAIEALDGRRVRLLLGPDVNPADAFAGAALVAASPSINPDYPTTEPRLRRALADLLVRRAGGDELAPALLSEVDLFLRLCPAPTVGITGTKGKTTTSALTHALLATDSAHPAVLGGNIGVPLVERLPELTPAHRVVLELSELQLPTLSRGTTVAAYTNVTADHLDRHGSLEAYQAVKRRLAELVDPAGALVLNDDDPIVAGYGAATEARVVRYRRGEVPVGGVGVAHDWIVADTISPVDGSGPGAGGRIMPIRELLLPGAHNVSNALAAVAVALLYGVAPAAIRQAAGGFFGVEHRLEVVALIDRVTYVNDSQGTQPDAVIAALHAFEPPIVLIAGGRSKQVDLSDLAPVVADRAAAAVLIGEMADEMAALFGSAGLGRIERAASMEEAVHRATSIAHELLGVDPNDPLTRVVPFANPDVPIATVLLSPAAASFDMFEDYEARGRAFKDVVLAASDRVAEE